MEYKVTLPKIKKKEGRALLPEGIHIEMGFEWVIGQMSIFGMVHPTFLSSLMGRTWTRHNLIYRCEKTFAKTLIQDFSSRIALNSNKSETLLVLVCLKMI